MKIEVRHSSTRLTCLVVCMALLYGCNQIDRNESDLKPIHPLLSKLEACGVELSKSKLAELSPDEGYVVLREHRELNSQELDCVADVLVKANFGLRSNDPKIATPYTQSWKRAFRQQIAAKSKAWLDQNRPSLRMPAYNKQEALSTFIKASERSCSAKAGTFRVAKGNQAAVYYNGYEDYNESDTCVAAVLSVGLAKEDIEISYERGVP